MSYLAFESGGTKLVAALAAESGHLVELAKSTRRPDQTAGETLEQLCRLGASLLPQARAPLRAVGYGFGGPISRGSGRPLASLTEPGWDRIELAQYLQRRFGVPGFVENDCNIAALGEALWGAGRNHRTVFYVTIGTGCGGGLVHLGRIVALADTGEAEFGHIVVDPDGPLCPCGNLGCIEAICSGPAIARRAQRLYGDLYPDARAVLQAFLAQDRRAAALVEETTRRLGQGLGIVASLINPDVIVIGGGVAQTGEPFLERLRYYTLRHTFALFRGRALVVPSELGENAVCQGAAAYARQQLEGEADS